MPRNYVEVDTHLNAFSLPWHSTEVSGQLYVSVTLLPVGQWVKPRGSLKAVDKTKVSATHQSLNPQSSHSND